MALLLDHTVVLINDLSQAVEDFTQLGFTVSPGGKHAGGISHNALIHFQDGTFIELLAIRPGSRSRFLKQMYDKGLLKVYQQVAKYGIAHRFYGRILDLKGPGEGITDFCLLANQEAHQQIQVQGVLLTPVFQAGRLRPGGQMVNWQMYTAIEDVLPFFRTGYVPAVTHDPAALKHQNGVEGTKKTVLFTSDYAQAVTHYQLLLPKAQIKKTNEVTTFTLANGYLELVNSSVFQRPEILQRVQSHGVGRFGLVMKNSQPDFVQKMQAGNTHGLVFLED